jgi:hypothetical protein
MTDEPVCRDQEESVLFVPNCMIDGGVRHLLIMLIMASGNVIGRVSIRHGLRAFSDVVRLS